MLARYAQDPGLRGLDTVDLGRGSWCCVRLENTGVKLNLNLAGMSALQIVLRAFIRDTRHADSLVAALVALRRSGPLYDVRALEILLGVDSSLVAALNAVLTTRGPGTIDVNAAPILLLATLPGMNASALAFIDDRRSVGHRMQSTDELVAFLSKESRVTLLAAYPEFLHAAVFAPQQLIAFIEGGVRGTPIVTRVTVTLVPTAGRLAVIRRETE